MRVSGKKDIGEKRGKAGTEVGVEDKYNIWREWMIKKELRK